MKLFFWALAIGVMMGVCLSAVHVHEFPDDTRKIPVVPEAK